MKSCFLQYLPCENNDSEVPDIENSSQKSINKWPGNKFENKTILNTFWTPKTDINRSRNHSKIDKNPVICNFVSILLLPWSSRVVPRCENGLPMCSRDAKMVPMVVPRCKNGFPRCSRGAKMGSRNVKKKAAPSLLNSNPSSQRGGTEPPKWQPPRAKRGQRQRA